MRRIILKNRTTCILSFYRGNEKVACFFLDVNIKLKVYRKRCNNMTIKNPPAGCENILNSMILDLRTTILHQ